MKDVVNKIKLNNSLWFTVLADKLVFGDNETDNDCHYTISFGNWSGHFDLHLTSDKTGEHFTIFKWSHENAFQVLPQLLDKVVHSVLDLAIVDEDKLNARETTIYQFRTIVMCSMNFLH